MKTLVIAEKPSVGRDIAKVLGCTKKGEGFLFSEQYIVSWAIGHLITLFEPEDYNKNFKKWTIESLPIVPENIKTKPIKNSKAQFDILKKLMNSKDTDLIICATDSGREGELIFRYIYNQAKCKKPFKRLWISSMTNSAIKEGFRNLKDGFEYDNLYLSAKCRSEADWLVGINASRAFTIKYKTLLSIGRVQTPTLAIIVKRYKEIESFVPKKYWEVEAVFNGYKSLWFDEKENSTKIFDKEEAQKISESVFQKNGIIENIENKKNKQLPPLLYDLTELQRDCNRKFSFSASHTLSIAQNLYEKRKLITYPRTDSRYLSDDMIGKINSVIKKIDSTEQYKSFSEYVINLQSLPITKRIIDNSKITDHHAIIPTDNNISGIINNLTSDEFKVFDIIIRRFLSVFYPDYIYNVTKIITLCEGHKFLTKGSTIIQKGWTVLDIESDKKKKSKKNEKSENEQILPDVKKGDYVVNEKIDVLDKETKPPKQYNEALLLSAMENAGKFVDDESIKEQLKENGLGTPATRASIIERLLDVGYIVRDGKNLNPTEKGIKLIEIVPSELKSPETTGKWEKGLSSINKGKMKTSRFMESIIRYVNYIIEFSKKSQNSVIFPVEQHGFNNKGRKKSKNIPSFGECPKCGKGYILENSKSFYCSEWKSGCNFSIWKNSISIYGKEIDSNDAKKLVKSGKIENIDIILPQTGEYYSSDLILKDDKSGFVELINLRKKQNN